MLRGVCIAKCVCVCDCVQVHTDCSVVFLSLSQCTDLRFVCVPMQEFQSGNMSQETAFQDAVTAVQQAASEQELDERVSAALGGLDS